MKKKTLIGTTAVAAVVVAFTVAANAGWGGLFW